MEPQFISLCTPSWRVQGLFCFYVPVRGKEHLTFVGECVYLPSSDTRLLTFACRACCVIGSTGDSQTVRRGTAGRNRIFQNIAFRFQFVLLFQKATKLLEQTDIKLLRPNCLMKGRVRYFFWPRDVVNKITEVLTVP